MVPPDGHLGELVERLRTLGAEPTAREIAEALWFARFVGRAPLSSTGPDASGDMEPEGEFRIDYTPPAWYTQQADAARTVPREEPGAGTRLFARRPAAGADDSSRLSTDVAGEALRVRVPMATALPRPLVLQRALRPLQHYRPPVRTPALHLDEQATAERAAETGLLIPVLRPALRREARLRLLMDVSTSTGVWDTALEELRQICAGLGAFREVTVHYVRENEDGRLVTSATRDGVRGARAAEQLRDPTGRQLTLVLSDCAGPLWRSGRMQRLLHHWGRAAPVAVVQPLPQRMWRRTHLSAFPGTLRRREGLGGWLAFSPADGGTPPGASPVPVLSLTRTALGTWARLLSGSTGLALPAPAAWVGADHSASLVAPARSGTDAQDLVRAFRRTASRPAVHLAVAFSAVPLTLPVMQLVQRAMQPRSGPAELAEVLLGGLLKRGPEEGWYDFRPGVREALLRLLPRGDALLVLKQCGTYIDRHFGRRARNFPALARASLLGQPAEGPQEDDGTVPSAFAEVSALVAGRFGAAPVPVRHEVELLHAVEDEPWARWAAHVLASASGGEWSVTLRSVRGTGRDLRELVRDSLSPPFGHRRDVVLLVGSWYAGFRFANPLGQVGARGDARLVPVTVVRTPAFAPFSWMRELEPVVPLWDTTETEAERRLLGALGADAARQARDAGRPRFPGPGLRVWHGVPADESEVPVAPSLVTEVGDALVSGRRPAVCAVIGPPGTGKSVLAARYAYQHAGSYDIVWWVRPGERRREHLAQLGVEFGLPVGRDTKARLAALRRELERTLLRWLIILDDCDLDAAADLLPATGGHILVTTRDERWDDEGIDVVRTAGTEAAGPGDTGQPSTGRAAEEAVVRVLSHGPENCTGFFLAPQYLVSAARLVTGPGEEVIRDEITVETVGGRRLSGVLTCVVGPLALFFVPEAVAPACFWLTDAPDTRPREVSVRSVGDRGLSRAVLDHRCRAGGTAGEAGMPLIGGTVPRQAVGAPVVDDMGALLGVVVDAGGETATGGRAVRIETLRDLCLEGRADADRWHEVVHRHDGNREDAWVTPPAPWQRDLYALFVRLPVPRDPEVVRSLLGKGPGPGPQHPPRSWRDGAGHAYAAGGPAAVLGYAARLWQQLAPDLRMVRELTDLRTWILERSQDQLPEERRALERALEQDGGSVARGTCRTTVEVGPADGEGRAWTLSAVRGERILYAENGRAPAAPAALSSALAEALRRAAHRLEKEEGGRSAVDVRLPEDLLWDLPVERWVPAALSPRLPVVVRGPEQDTARGPQYEARWSALSAGRLIGFRSPGAGLPSTARGHDLRAHLLNAPANAVPLLCRHGGDGEEGPVELNTARAVGFPLILWSRSPRHDDCVAFYRHVLDEVQRSSGVRDFLARVTEMRFGGSGDDWARYVAVYYNPPHGAITGP
ncbi:SCO5717 family growth-regulating ATPase [Streptomyces rochei]|uniref:SCO5717 family growth-regulating ATPase n=1 Tax=Streptomyces rochei TaxID=1928 RepID=A0ABW7E438_STRRO|nr:MULTISPECIES: SCO5717 family growth-regulating ATPase [unclassified Streptomyces]MBU8551890.1 hypothetical protein [Streptomyces sp. Osf17]MBU8558668.1 hypothetical protein [Streptomyces sp. Babs14]